MLEMHRQKKNNDNKSSAMFVFKPVTIWLTGRESSVRVKLTLTEGYG